MVKRLFTCPTCEKDFEKEVDSVLLGFGTGRNTACIHYCSVACNTWLPEQAEKARQAQEKGPTTCACGQQFVTYSDTDTKCQICRLPSGLRNALSKIEAEFGVN